ncbi:hypothetical protein RDWZM_007361 [Blomia tropicalis]|uniref:Peptidase C1A papain C-terminal domain-containing protein n=1 Tax=Blomia tropicalis TaxID=40697 RepID=A0A9Q0RIY9_BLOTA|nr:hypothetical protein RDWZM_007361 [Blomia tropicalis]
MEKRILSIFCCLIITGCLILIGIIYLSTHNRDNNRTLMGNRWSYEELSANFYRIYGNETGSIRIKSRPYNGTELMFTLPKRFDSRQYWPQCFSVINRINDQGACGSCWAVTAADTITDRLCIATNGTIRERISAADLIECCRSGQCSISDSGCNGGNPYLAFKYFVENGLVGERCKRYPVPPCRKVSEDIKRDICWLTTDHLFPVGSCRKQCDNDSEEYAQNLYRGNDYYDFWDSSIDDVKRDIVQYGPVVANIPVFEKLLDYG